MVKVKWVVCHHCGGEHVVGGDETYFCRGEPHHVVEGDQVFDGSLEDGWYLVESPTACGGVRVQGGRVAEACPYYWHLVGKSYDVLSGYRTLKVSKVGEEP